MGFNALRDTSIRHCHRFSPEIPLRSLYAQPSRAIIYRQVELKHYLECGSHENCHRDSDRNSLSDRLDVAGQGIAAG